MDTQTTIKTVRSLTGKSTFATVTYITEANKKTGLLKKEKSLILVNAVYANAVNNQREREGMAKDFKPSLPRYGIGDKKLLHYKNTDYLRYIKLKTLEESYFLQGKEVLKESTSHMLKKSIPYSQGTVKKVFFRNLKISNIIRLNIEKRELIDKNLVTELQKMGIEC